MSSTLERLRRASAAVAAAIARRDAAIIAAADDGQSLRTIGHAAGVSHQGVANVLRRHVPRDW